MFNNIKWNSPEVVAFAAMIPIAGWIYVIYVLYVTLFKKTHNA